MTLLKKLWANEPVRLALYPILAALVVAGIAKAGLDSSVATLLITLIAGVLGVPVVSAIRNQVTSPATAAAVVDAAAKQIEAVAQSSGIPPQAQILLDQARVGFDDIRHRFGL